MSNGGSSWTVLDGADLRAIRPRIPASDSVITGEYILQMAESEASSVLFGLPLPSAIKSSAFSHLRLDDAVAFSNTLFDHDQASSLLIRYLSAIADELKDDPIVVSVLDGSTLKMLLEDEDEFAMLAENLFTDLDNEDKGMISKSKMQSAFLCMNAEMGVPPFSDYPLLNDIINKHGVDEVGDLGQAQFAQILQLILQDLADALAKNNVVVVRNINIINGSKMRKLLGDEEQLDNIIANIWQKYNDGENVLDCKKMFRSFVEEHGVADMGLPPLESNLYDGFLADINDQSRVAGLEKGKFGIIVKEIFEKFAAHLEKNPFFHDLEL